MTIGRALLLLLLWSSWAGAEDTGRLAALELRDQYGNVDSLARHGGTPVVVVVVSVRRLALIEKWERDLTDRVPGIRFLNVADLPTDVPVDLDRTALTLQKKVPPGVNVLMDSGRAWATTFGLDTTLPNLLVFDAAGQLTARFRGRWSAELAAEVAAAMPRPEAAP
ncbi:MAG: hypothetical protein JNK40_09965 [Chromatiales bacterium]|nr:hypothetical protein [Chromatiales bacterium]